MGFFSISRGGRISTDREYGIGAGQFVGYRGGIIHPHRAFAKLRPSVSDVITSLILALATTVLWISLLGRVGELWGAILKFWVDRLSLKATVLMIPQNWAPHLRFSLPFLSMPAGPITSLSWFLTAVVSTAAFTTTYFIDEEYLAWIYIVRAMTIIQVSALIYFAVAAVHFPHDLPTYTTGMLSFGVILIGLVPIVLGLTYYLFDFILWKKLALTAIILIYLTLFIPLQYTLHACILHFSMLYMPLLYFIFGPFLDVLIFICFYSWGMSWKPRQPVLPNS